MAIILSSWHYKPRRPDLFPFCCSGNKNTMVVNTSFSENRSELHSCWTLVTQLFNNTIHTILNFAINILQLFSQRPDGTNLHYKQILNLDITKCWPLHRGLVSDCIQIHTCLELLWGWVPFDKIHCILLKRDSECSLCRRDNVSSKNQLLPNWYLAWYLIFSFLCLQLLEKTNNASPKKLVQLQRLQKGRWACNIRFWVCCYY